jgi:hypothetical protein
MDGSRRFIAAIAAALAGTLAFGAPAASGLETSARATDEVQRWASKKSFDSPYALVEVIHDGRRLDRTPITRCKGQYADRSVTVQISTCGRRWRVRAAYVSMNGRREHFRIVYAPRERPPGSGAPPQPGAASAAPGVSPALG